MVRKSLFRRKVNSALREKALVTKQMVLAEKDYRRKINQYEKLFPGGVGFGSEQIKGDLITSAQARLASTNNAWLQHKMNAEEKASSALVKRRNGVRGVVRLLRAGKKSRARLTSVKYKGFDLLSGKK